MSALPTVSVAMINRDYGHFLGDALESVLAQTHPAVQVVVVDDGSTDHSLEVLARYRGRVTSIATPPRGKGAATSTAVASCTGDVVALLDSDDLMAPTRLQRLAEAYASDPGAQWVWHGMQHVRRPSGEVVPWPPLQGFTPGAHDHRAAVRRGRLPLAAPATSALSWRRSFLLTLLPLPPRVRSQDNYLKALTLGLAPGRVLAEPLALQGLHDENAYTTAVGAQRRRLAALRLLDLAPGLLQHDLAVLQRRVVADALAMTSGGLELAAADRALLRQQVRAGGPGLLPWVPLAAARRARAALRSRRGRPAAAPSAAATPAPPPPV